MTAALTSATTTEERIAVVRELGKVTAELEARRVALAGNVVPLDKARRR